MMGISRWSRAAIGETRIIHSSHLSAFGSLRTFSGHGTPPSSSAKPSNLSNASPVFSKASPSSKFSSAVPTRRRSPSTSDNVNTCLLDCSSVASNIVVRMSLRNASLRLNVSARSRRWARVARSSTSEVGMCPAVVERLVPRPDNASRCSIQRRSKGRYSGPGRSFRCLRTGLLCWSSSVLPIYSAISGARWNGTLHATEFLRYQ